MTTSSLRKSRWSRKLPSCFAVRALYSRVWHVFWDARKIGVLYFTWEVTGIKAPVNFIPNSDVSTQAATKDSKFLVKLGDRFCHLELGTWSWIKLSSGDWLRARHWVGLEGYLTSVLFLKCLSSSLAFHFDRDSLKNISYWLNLN